MPNLGFPELIVVLLIRPQGLLGKAQRVVERTPEHDPLGALHG